MSDNPQQRRSGPDTGETTTPTDPPGGPVDEPAGGAGGHVDAGRQDDVYERQAALVYGERLDEYPLREPGEDPRWAVRTVKGWVWFIVFCLAFVMTMLVLGLFYD